MGAGKSTLGKKMAKNLDFTFLDADREIEKQTGKKIATLFEENGEIGFRKIETEWLINLTPNEPAIIALGGGMPCFNNNLSIIHQKGVSVYLKRSPHTLVDRLLNSKNNRPLIEKIKGDEKKLLHLVQDMLTKREDCYMQANFIMRNHSFSPAQINAILAHLSS